MVDTASLRLVPLFRELDEKSLEFLAKHVEVLDLGPGEVVYRERDPGDALYIVGSGELSITKVIDWDDMNEKVLAVVGKDAFFGEMALLDQEPRSASVRTVSAARLLIVRRANFLDLLQQSAVVATKLLLSIIRTVNSRLRQTNRQLVTLYDTGKIIGSVRDLTTMAEDIMERVTETLGVKRGLLVLVNPYSSELETKHVTGYTVEEEALFRLRLDEGFLGTIFEKKAPMRFEGDPQTLPSRAGFETSSMLLCPLVSNDVAIGAIVLGNKDSGEPFSNDDENLVAGVATQVATAVENARMVEEREAKERHQRVYITY